MKNLLDKINEAIESLDERDVEGHIWWDRFKELVEAEIAKQFLLLNRY